MVRHVLDYILRLSKGGTDVQGEVEITENGTYDISAYASAKVNVPAPRHIANPIYTLYGTVVKN